MKIRAMVTVKGLVQGVSYRYHTLQMASGLDITGWVRNMPNGDVQGCFEGEKTDVEALIDWCRIGPRLASVDRVIVEQEPFSGEFRGFKVR